MKLIQFIPWSPRLHCTAGITREKGQVMKSQRAGFIQLMSPILQGAVLKFRSWIQCTAVPRTQCSLWVSSSHELESCSPNSRSIYEGAWFSHLSFPKTFHGQSSKNWLCWILTLIPWVDQITSEAIIYVVVLVLTWNSDFKILPGIRQYKFNKIYTAWMLRNNKIEFLHTSTALID